MADDADSKSVAGNRVWVQVPPPAGSGHAFSMLVFLCTRSRRYGHAFSMPDSFAHAYKLIILFYGF